MARTTIWPVYDIYKWARKWRARTFDIGGFEIQLSEVVINGNTVFKLVKKKTKHLGFGTIY